MSYLDLTMRQVGILFALLSGKKKLVELAKLVECSGASMTGTKDSLVKLGLVEEMSVSGDRRCRPIVLSASGLKVVKDVKAFIESQKDSFHTA
jgi:DNA-binding MarR family transcriptional regulator